MINVGKNRGKWAINEQTNKRTNEPVRLRETCALPIEDHHISIARSISFLVVRLGNPAYFSPCASNDSNGPSPLEAALAFLFR